MKYFVRANTCTGEVNFLSNNLMKILVGFIQIRVAISKIGIEKLSHWSIRCIGNSI